jgi:multicomponent Na+:H+ antiporter subunit B
MRSEILKIAALHLKPLLLILSLIVLYRGHNEPGGGFVGGLLAGTAFVLHALAFGVEYTKKLRLVKPFFLIALGLLFGILSSLIAVILGHELFMQGVWISIPLMGDGVLKLGTPLLFDIGVYFVVAGMLMLVMLSIMEED